MVCDTQDPWSTAWAPWVPSNTKVSNMGKSTKILAAVLTAGIWQVTSEALALAGTGSCSQDVFKRGVRMGLRDSSTKSHGKSCTGDFPELVLVPGARNSMFLVLCLVKSLTWRHYEAGMGLLPLTSWLMCTPWQSLQVPRLTLHRLWKLGSGLASPLLGSKRISFSSLAFSPS